MAFACVSYPERNVSMGTLRGSLLMVAAVVPFRYSRLVFAMILGALVFAERPDPMQ